MNKTKREQLVKELRMEQLAEQNMRERFAREVKRLCRADLDKIAQQGIPARVIVDWVEAAAEKRMFFFPEKSKQELRNRMTLWKELLVDIEKLTTKGRTIVGLPQALEPWAFELKDGIKQARRYLRENGRRDHDQDIQILMRMIFRFNEQFNCWEALARVISQAYVAAGREEEALSIVADKLMRVAKPYRGKGVTP